MGQNRDPSLQGLRVLIAEDEALTLKHLTRAVYKAGMEVYSYASDGITGLNRALEGTPDILILDVKMPYLSGTEVARRVFEHYDPCVVFVTSYGQEVLAHSSERVRRCPIVVKPVTSDILLPQIAAAWRAHSKIVRRV